MIKVYLALCPADLPFFDWERQEIQALFSPSRREGLAGRIPSERKRSAAGQWLLKELLGRYAPDTAFPPRFAFGWQDKPSLADEPSLHFNISHSGRWAACVLSSVPVGVDVQEERPIRPSLVRKFSLSEQKLLHALPTDQFSHKIMDIWCLKEAYCKCTGDGLRTPLSAASFTLNPLSIDKAGYTVLLPPPPQEHYHLALCLRTEEEISLQTLILPPSHKEKQP